jgi:hypothetical protein
MLFSSRRWSLFPRSIVPHALVAAALLLVSALPATAQDDRFLRLEPNCRHVVDVLMDSARVLGLPDSALRSTALQGMQKKVDGRRICDAVRNKFGLLKTALGVLGPVDGQELDAAARVLEAGGKPTQLAAFKPREKGRDDLLALTVWTDLIYRGVPGDEASNAITRLWQDGADEATFRRLWKDVQTDISQGLNPGAALRAWIRQSAPLRTPPKSPTTTPEG